MGREWLAIVLANNCPITLLRLWFNIHGSYDNRPLKWLQTLCKLTKQIAWRILKLQKYVYEIVHRAGSANRTVNALSRIPINALFLRNDKSIIELRDKQRSDPDLMPVIKCLSSGEEFDSSSEISLNGWQLLRRIDEFDLTDKVLVRRFNNKGHIQEQVVVSRILQPEILRWFHDDPTGGHLSRDKMLGKIRERYYWLGINKDLKRHCKCCIKCQTLKPPHVMPIAPLQPIVWNRAFEMVSMDVCGPYPNSERGNRYILVIPNHFTKWGEAYAMPNHKTTTIAFCLEHVVNTFGYPDVIHTDQGRNFESKQIKEMCVRLKIDKRTTAANHSQCNGQIWEIYLHDERNACSICRKEQNGLGFVASKRFVRILDIYSQLNKPIFLLNGFWSYTETANQFSNSSGTAKNNSSDNI